jgi:hypothetical protein
MVPLPELFRSSTGDENMKATKGWIAGRLIAMVVSFAAGALLVWTQTNQSRVVGDETLKPHGAVQKPGIAGTLVTGLTTSVMTSANSVYQNELTFAPQTALPLVPTPTTAPVWSHGTPFVTTLTFPTQQQATNFLGALLDCTAYYQDKLTSNPSRWSLIRAAASIPTVTANGVDLTFMALCPFDHSHSVHNGTSDGTGRIVVISMTSTQTPATAAPVAPTSFVFFNNHGSINLKEN